MLRSIKELEFDYAMKKVAQADYDEMVGRLRARAIRIMRQLDAGEGYRHAIEKELKARLAAMGQPPAVRHAEVQVADGRPPGERTTCACGVANDPDARFCKACGTKLSA